MKDLPCADCGLVITVRVKQDRTADGVPVLCDPCLQDRVAQIRAGQADKGHAILTETSPSRRNGL
jgi:hypothetical protein